MCNSVRARNQPESSNMCCLDLTIVHTVKLRWPEVCSQGSVCARVKFLVCLQVPLALC